jgi:hypothetical protein
VKVQLKGFCSIGLPPVFRAAAFTLAVVSAAAGAQDVPAKAPVQAAPPSTELPRVTVTAPYTTTHGGYVISSDFRVDPRMPSVVFPAQALQQDDILSIRPVHLNPDEYLVLQECAQADCAQAANVRVWNSAGAVNTYVGANPERIWIKHENKYFIFLKRLPLVTGACGGCGDSFTSFEPVSPPMTLYPRGQAASMMQAELAGHAEDPAIPVVSQSHEESEYVVRFEGGSVVRIKRMHAAADDNAAPLSRAGP